MTKQTKIDVSVKRDAYFLSHNGLGDNITSIGAVTFLLQYYSKIYFLCKDYNEQNVKLLFGNKSVVTIPLNSKREFAHSKEIINAVNRDKYDIFISGMHKRHLVSSIKNEAIINYNRNNDKYSLKYSFITNFYKDNMLDTSIYVDFFDIKTTESSRLYKGIQEKQIIFIHTQASNKTIDLSKIVENFINKENYIIICPNKNVYNNEHINYALADTYVMLKVAHYIDLILNAEELHVIDSCFSAMIYPLLLSEKLKAKKCIIYGR